MKFTAQIPLTNPRVFIAMILAASVSCLTLAFQADRNERGQSPTSKESLRHAFALSDAFKDAARLVGPSVVNIRSTARFDSPSVEKTPENPQIDPSSPFNDEFFRRFFGEDAPEGFREFRFQQPQQPRARIGEGTGVIAREDGYILTNNHVVDGATEIRVRLDDEREYDGTVVGTDSESDLAVLKIEATGLTPAKWGNSDRLEIGEWVLALGSPFGLQHTVTAGIVSAKSRANMGLATFEDFIQTDAAINPGNSGGPLVNLYGEVVGINTAINTRTGGFMGIGFAIPSNMVSGVMNSIIETGSVQQGTLGVQIAPLSKEHAEYYGFEGTQGVLIADVYPDKAAAIAGIRYGDIVVRVDGQQTPDSRTLLNAVAAHKPGDKIGVEVFRDGSTRKFEVTLDSRSSFQTASAGRSNQPRQGNLRQPPSDELGIVVEELTPDLARQLNAPDRTGVVVARVTPNSPAAEKGIARGDIISRVDDMAIATTEEFSQAIANIDKNTGIALQVYRDGAARIVVLKSQRKNDGQEE